MMGTGVKANKGIKYRNGDGRLDGNGDWVGTRTGRRIETRGRTQDGNGDGNRDGNESSSGNGNEDEDGNEDENEDGIVDGGREVKKRNRQQKSCRRDQALSFRTRHHLCRQGGLRAPDSSVRKARYL